MARPAGHALSRPAFDDFTRLAGLSQTEIAERADIPRSTLSGLYRGHQRASIPMAHRIANAIGVQPSTLFPSLLQVAEVAS